MEGELKKLATDRKIIKSKISTVKRKLDQAVRDDDFTKAKSLYESMCHLFNEEYCSIHEDFSECLAEAEAASDGSASNYMTVNGMTADEHFTSVQSVFTQAADSFSYFSKSYLTKELQAIVEIPIGEAKQLIQELEVFLTYDNATGSKPVLDSATVCIAELKELHARYIDKARSGDFGGILGEVTSCILNVSSRVTKLQSKSASEDIAKSSGFSGSQNNPLSSQLSPDSVSSPSQAHYNSSGANATTGVSYQQTLTATMLEGSGNPSFNMGGAQNSYTRSSMSRFKKPDPPTFSGGRREWPDFKANWEYYCTTELANDFERASALRTAVRADAFHMIKPVQLDESNAYKEMWGRLESHYSDVSLCVQAVYDDLRGLKTVNENDAGALVRFVNDVEEMYGRLRQVQVDSSITMFQIDDICTRLPSVIVNEWEEKYHGLANEEKLRPFSHFINFLSIKRRVFIRRAERQGYRKATVVTSDDRGGERNKVRSMHTKSGEASSRGWKDILCVIHPDSVEHRTSGCKDFARLSLTEKYGKLKSFYACFRCFSTLHRRSACLDETRCTECASDAHHSLLCNKAKEKSTAASAKCSSSKEEASAILAMCRVSSGGCDGERITVFFDNGSDSSYITHDAAKRIHASRGKNLPLCITKVGGSDSDIVSCVYSFELMTVSGEKVPIKAYGIDKITGPVCQLDRSVITYLFPEQDASLVDRGVTVGILLGTNWFGYHPKQETDTAGDHLSVMTGVFGPCLVGRHHGLRDSTVRNPALVNSCVNQVVVEGSEVLKVNACAARVTVSEVEDFITGEGLGVGIHPRCGGCKCGKCPMAGHSYSFQEEQELRMIQENLKFDSENKVWTTSYPWIVDPGTLPDNYSAAMATLVKTERSLDRDEMWAAKYSEQIADMVNRGVARKLSLQESREWQGPKFYLSHLAVKNPKSLTTPVRIVFNSSQPYRGISLNSALAKGPDSYMNNLLGILLRWREESQVIVGDIRKMYNSVFIGEVEAHCHRFLWRNLDSSRPPDIYVIQRVNMGDRPAGAISTEAIYKTAAMFSEEYPQVANLLIHSTYVDDIVDSVASKEEAVKLACETSLVLERAGFRVKAWHIGGEASARIDPSVAETSFEIPLPQQVVRVLGVRWDPVKDIIQFQPTLNFSKKQRGVYSEPNIGITDFPGCIPTRLTRRMVLEQVMKMYDPFGFLSPFLLMAKFYLRETWSLKLEWDEAVPNDMREKWVAFFHSLWEISDLEFDRCIKPDSAVGLPILVILSDGSEMAYGCTAYIRWVLDDGSAWCRLILAKCRIAPMNRISIPQMELNGAVLSKRIRAVLESELRFKFERVFHLVDSETVLCMVNKLSTKFKVYEGVRIGEIQAGCNGEMGEWFWIPGVLNIADWITRSHGPSCLGSESEWWRGPQFMCSPVDSWPIKNVQELGNLTNLPGEKKCVQSCATGILLGGESLVKYSQSSSSRKIRWAVARVLSILRNKSFRGGNITLVSVQCYRDAQKIIIMDVQKSIESDLAQGNRGKYKMLSPIVQDGVWVVGSRLREHNPLVLSPDSAAQALLPTMHDYTRLCMREAHENCAHRGRDATLARFRQQFWTPQGGKVAKGITSRCRHCRKLKGERVQYPIGNLPTSRLCPSPPFSRVMVDLFGPYVVKDDIRKRSRGKAYGVLFTDLFSRAVHVEVVSNYDAESFRSGFLRFTSVRGWPETVYSDPGSQIVCVAKELRKAWKVMDQSSLYKLSIENGMKWEIGPADSPWYQGAVESMVKSMKLAIKFSMGSEVLSKSEFETVCKCAANVVNERPLGTIPSDDAEISILTPNSLLLGRSIAMNPGYSCALVALGERRHIIAGVMQDFWRRWCTFFAPTMFRVKGGPSGTRNLKVGDVVVVTESNSLRQGYYIARVKNVYPSRDGIVRKVGIVYRNFRIGDKVHEYKVSPEVLVIRGVKNLTLLVGVDEADD